MELYTIVTLMPGCEYSVLSVRLAGAIQQRLRKPMSQIHVHQAILTSNLDAFQRQTSISKLR